MGLGIRAPFSLKTQGVGSPLSMEEISQKDYGSSGFDPTVMASSVQSEVGKATSKMTGLQTAEMIGKIAAPILTTGVGILDGLLTWWGMKEQKREAEKNRRMQIDLYNQQKAEDTRRYGLEFAESKRRYGIESTLAQRGQALKELQVEKEYGLAEKQLGTEIQETKLNRIEAKKQNAIDQQLLVMTNLSRFFNTPQIRAQYSQIWG